MIYPDWPAPAQVKACITTRVGGHSLAPYQGFNLALHVGDQPSAVAANREALAQLTGVSRWQWLEQVHGTHIVTANSQGACPQADGASTEETGLALAILTADCLPVLLCNQQGTHICALHAGWRGLAAGIIKNAVARFRQPASQLMAYLGPCIGPAHFEVGPEVKAAFLQQEGLFHTHYPTPAWASAFEPSARSGHAFAHLALLARLQLQALGVTAVYGGQQCTYSQTQRFYSYRREGLTGRFASVIWLNPPSPAHSLTATP